MKISDQMRCREVKLPDIRGKNTLVLSDRDLRMILFFLFHCFSLVKRAFFKMYFIIIIRSLQWLILQLLILAGQSHIHRKHKAFIFMKNKTKVKLRKRTRTKRV